MNIYFDFDATIADSQTAFLQSYAQRHDLNVVPSASWVKRWDFKDVLPNIQKSEIMDIFESRDFWGRLKFFDGMKELVEETATNFKTFIVSKGTVISNHHKAEWILTNLKWFPMSNIILENSLIMDKSYVCDDGCKTMLIDDHQDNLYTAKCSHKVLVNHFGNITDWNDRAMADERIIKAHSAGDIRKVIRYVDF